MRPIEFCYRCTAAPHAPARKYMRTDMRLYRLGRTSDFTQKKCLQAENWSNQCFYWLDFVLPLVKSKCETRNYKFFQEYVLPE